MTAPIEPCPSWCVVQHEAGERYRFHESKAAAATISCHTVAVGENATVATYVGGELAEEPLTVNIEWSDYGQRHHLMLEVAEARILVRNLKSAIALAAGPAWG